MTLSNAAAFKNAVATHQRKDLTRELEKLKSKLSDLTQHFEGRYGVAEWTSWPVSEVENKIEKAYDLAQEAASLFDDVEGAINDVQNDIQSLQDHIDDLTEEKARIEEELHALANATNQTPNFMRNYTP